MRKSSALQYVPDVGSGRGSFVLPENYFPREGSQGMSEEERIHLRETLFKTCQELF